MKYFNCLVSLMALYKIYVVKRGQLEKRDRNNLRVFKYDAGEGWIRSDEIVMLENEFLDVVQEERHILCREKQRCIGLFTLCIGTAVAHVHGKEEGMGR